MIPSPETETFTLPVLFVYDSGDVEEIKLIWGGERYLTRCSPQAVKSYLATGSGAEWTETANDVVRATLAIDEDFSKDLTVEAGVRELAVELGFVADAEPFSDGGS